MSHRDVDRKDAVGHGDGVGHVGDRNRDRGRGMGRI